MRAAAELLSQLNILYNVIYIFMHLYHSGSCVNDVWSVNRSADLLACSSSHHHENMVALHHRSRSLKLNDENKKLNVCVCTLIHRPSSLFVRTQSSGLKKHLSDSRSRLWSRDFSPYKQLLHYTKCKQTEPAGELMSRLTVRGKLTGCVFHVCVISVMLWWRAVNEDFFLSADRRD